MGAATEFRSPHRRDAPAYLSTVEDLITYLWTGDGLRLGATVAFELDPYPGECEQRAPRGASGLVGSVLERDEMRPRGRGMGSSKARDQDIAVNL